MIPKIKIILNRSINYMNDLGFNEMQKMQISLQEKYFEKWGGLSPEKAREKLLWMMAEAGEAADVIKQNGDAEIMKSGEVRKHFIEEMCDVMMYFNDVLLCYGIKPEEVRKIYLEKYERNMSRW